MTSPISGLAFPVGSGGRGGPAVARGDDKLAQGLAVLLLTYPGERVGRPDYGCTLRDYVFDSPTPDVVSQLAAAVARAVRLWEPRVVLLDVDVRPDPATDGLLRLLVSYQVSGDAEPAELVLDMPTDRAEQPGRSGQARWSVRPGSLRTPVGVTS